MTDEMKQALKEYLKENLTIENSNRCDIYGDAPDEITITFSLEGEVIASTILNPLTY